MNTPELLVIVPGKMFQLPIGAMLFCVQACHTVFLTPCGELVITNLFVLDSSNNWAWEEVSEP